MQCRAKLLTDREKMSDQFYFKFNRGTLIMTDMKTTVDTLAQGIVHKIINPNEARAKLDMNPYDGGDSYSNPNITTDPIDPSGDTSGDNDADEAEAPNQAAAAQAQLQHMVGVECNRIQQRGLRAKNFVEWVDGFYARWQERLESTAGAEDCDVAAYCERHKNALLSAADKQPAEFVQAVKQLLESWRSGGVAELMQL